MEYRTLFRSSAVPDTRRPCAQAAWRRSLRAASSAVYGPDSRTDHQGMRIPQTARPRSFCRHQAHGLSTVSPVSARNPRSVRVLHETRPDVVIVVSGVTAGQNTSPSRMSCDRLSGHQHVAQAGGGGKRADDVVRLVLGARELGETCRQNSRLVQIAAQIGRRFAVGLQRIEQGLLRNDVSWRVLKSKATPMRSGRTCSRRSDRNRAKPICGHALRCRRRPPCRKAWSGRREDEIAGVDEVRR